MSYTYLVNARVTTPSGTETVNCTTTHGRAASEQEIKAALADDAAKRYRIPVSKVSVQVNAFVPA